MTLISSSGILIKRFWLLTSPGRNPKADCLILFAVICLDNLFAMSKLLSTAIIFLAPFLFATKLKTPSAEPRSRTAFPCTSTQDDACIVNAEYLVKDVAARLDVSKSKM